MSAWKQFLASDIIVTPFTVNKGFTFTSGIGINQFAYLGYTSSVSGEIIDTNAVGINRFIGRNGDYFLSSSDAYLTGQLTSSLSGSVPAYYSDFTQYNTNLVYRSAQQLYYSNYLTSSKGDDVTRPILIPGADVSGNVLIGSTENTQYDNYLQSTLTPTRFWPTASGAIIGIISIPSKLFGDYIQPRSVRIVTGSFIITDDGEGNLVLNNTYNIGNVIYPHGMLILTNSGSYCSGNGEGPVVVGGGYGIDVYGDSPDVYGGGLGFTLIPAITNICTGSISLSFSSSYTIYEAQYKCTIRESEFNTTLNPSAQQSGSVIEISGSSFYQRGDGTLNNNVTGSYFSPYVTTVGLYDEAQNLLAIGKLSQPLPTSATTDTTILVNIDK